MPAGESRSAAVVGRAKPGAYCGQLRGPRMRRRGPEVEGTLRTVLRRGIAMAVLAALAVAAALATLLFSREQAPARANALAATLDEALQRGASPAQPALAVLPFEAPAGDAELNEIGAALCDALLERLSRSRDLATTTCNASRIAVQVGMDRVQIARLLGVERLVEGSLDRAGTGGYRLRAELLEARSGRVVLQVDEIFDETRLRELPGWLVDRLVAAQSVAAVSGVPEPPSGRAFRLYLQSLTLSRRGGADDLRAARALLDESLALAPDYPPAVLARVALASQLAGLGIGTGAEVDARVRQAAAHLARVDPHGPQALTLAATAALGARRWSEAHDKIGAAAAGSPHHAPTLHTQAGLLMIMGYLEQARAAALRAALLEPLVASTHERLARAHGLLGDDARMVESAELARDLGFHDRVAAYFGLAALRRGDAAAAIREYETALKRAGAPTDWIAPMIRAAADPAQRAAALAAFEAVPAATRARLNELFLAYAIAGEPQRALQALERMSQQTVTMWATDVWAPEMAAVRRLPAFADYLEAMGLPALWDRHGAPDLCSRQPDGRYRCR